jgi:hypothetical protein
MNNSEEKNPLHKKQVQGLIQGTVVPGKVLIDSAEMTAAIHENIFSARQVNA